MTRDEFLAWEQASRDTIDVKRCYIDLAGKDLVAGILLSQILYWHLPGKTGSEKLTIHKDGVSWLAKGRADWWDECRISPKQFDRAASLLKELGLIETDVKRFCGNPTVHVRICWDVFLSALAALAQAAAEAKFEREKSERSRQATEDKNDIPQRSITKLTFGEKQSPPNGNNQIAQTSISLTETSSEKTKKNTPKTAALPAVPPASLPAAFPGEEGTAEEGEPLDPTVAAKNAVYKRGASKIKEALEKAKKRTE